MTFTDNEGIRISTNAGKTSHTGIEAGLGLRPMKELELQGSFSYAVHRFETWRPSASVDLSGNEMDVAPRALGYASVTYVPRFADGSGIALEWRRVGSYWMDPENTVQYDGHDVVHLVVTAALPYDLSVFGRLSNLTDERYAERISMPETWPAGSISTGLRPAISFKLGVRIRANKAPRFRRACSLRTPASL